ncbi:MAG TPA: hypothetical protein VMA36_20740 [Candidatus Limnocylindria bacterium]|nr:hypothetical protein [Candidatus Limnocylindria bacterium]
MEFLRARIPDYADYATEDARHQVDKQMRAALGEALAVMREQLAPEGPLLEQLDGLMLRCEFSDYRVVRVAEHACFGASLLERVHALDRRIVEAAEHVRAVTSPEELAAALDGAARALDARSGAIAEAPVR